MKISTKGRYAVRLLLDIAMNDEVEPVRLKDVAERQDISMKYLEQIISTLVRAGFVKSIRRLNCGREGLSLSARKSACEMPLTNRFGS